MEKIIISTYAWITGSSNYKLCDNLRHNNLIFVSELIDANQRAWRRDVIHDTFSSRDANNILQIPLASETHDDLMVWRGERSGEFSVRSAYELLQVGANEPNSNIIQTDSTNLFRNLWNLQLPPKIKITV